MLLEAVLAWLGRLLRPFADDDETSPLDPLLSTDADVRSTWG